jgi:conjugal transfer/entry exclusion protein
MADSAMALKGHENNQEFHMKENTYMRKHFSKSTLVLAMGVALTFAGQASAQVVFDPANFMVNAFSAKNSAISAGANVSSAATGAVSAAALIDIRKNMEKTERSNKEIENYTYSIDNTTQNIYDLDVENHTVNKNYTWITNNNYGDGDPVIIPIPGSINGYMASLDDANVGERVANFREATDYTGASDAGKIDANADIAGSRTQKSANDALVNLLSSQRSNIGGEAEAIKGQTMRATSPTLRGHAEQLQNAAGLAGLQANQLVQMRALMIASQNQQAAAAQAAGDRQAREIASAKSLRRSFGTVNANDEQQPTSTKASW